MYCLGLLFQKNRVIHRERIGFGRIKMDELGSGGLRNSHVVLSVVQCGNCQRASFVYVRVCVASQDQVLWWNVFVGRAQEAHKRQSYFL